MAKKVKLSFLANFLSDTTGYTDMDI